MQTNENDNINIMIVSFLQKASNNYIKSRSFDISKFGLDRSGRKLP